jgi:hypothetical protein
MEVRGIAVLKGLLLSRRNIRLTVVTASYAEHKPKKKGEKENYSHR